MVTVFLVGSSVSAKSGFLCPLIRELEQGKGAVMEVLTSFQHRAALLMVPTELEELTWQLTLG